MATHAALDVTTWLSGYDLTGDSNQTTLDIEYEPLSDTTYGDDAQSRLAGLEDVTTQVAGWYQAGTGLVDPELFTGLGSTLQTISQSPDGAESSVAYFWQTKKFNYQVFGQVGEVNPFQLDAQGVRGNGTLSAGAVRGRIAKTKGNVSAVGPVGSGVNLGAGAAGKFLYATLHAFSAGTTMTVEIQSDADNTFATPTVVATFPAVTAVGGSWLTRVNASAITDTWFRFNIPTAGIAGTFSVAGAIAIQ